MDGDTWLHIAEGCRNVGVRLVLWLQQSERSCSVGVRRILKGTARLQKKNSPWRRLSSGLGTDRNLWQKPQLGFRARVRRQAKPRDPAEVWKVQAAGLTVNPFTYELPSFTVLSLEPRIIFSSLSYFFLQPFLCTFCVSWAFRGQSMGWWLLMFPIAVQNPTVIPWLLQPILLH